MRASSGGIAGIAPWRVGVTERVEDDFAPGSCAIHVEPRVTWGESGPAASTMPAAFRVAQFHDSDHDTTEPAEDLLD